jgi:hypothetical protein
MLSFVVMGSVGRCKSRSNPLPREECSFAKKEKKKKRKRKIFFPVNGGFSQSLRPGLYVKESPRTARPSGRISPGGQGLNYVTGRLRWGMVRIVAGGISIITGAGLAAQMEGKGGVAVSYFGDGASNAGPFHECLNIAATLKLPMIYVCENNMYAAQTAACTPRKPRPPQRMR